MRLALDQLPNDVTRLKQLIVSQQQERAAEVEQLRAEHEAALQAAVEQAVEPLQAAVEQANQEVENAKQEVEQAQQELERLQLAMALLLQRQYGPRSEKFDPRQLLLFGEIVDSQPLDEADLAEETGEKLVTRRVQRRTNPGRQTLPEHLERIEIEHDLTDKACPACGHERCRIGAEISEQLEYFPAMFKVLKHVRHKYACQACNHDGYSPQIAVAQKPPQPLEKGLAGPSLLAYVITSKLADHLPLYRLENIFARQQLHVSRSTLGAWLRVAGELVTPLVELLTERVKQSRVIHTDDTTVPIQAPGAKQCRQGRIWCYVGDEQHPYTVYAYTPSRARAGPAEWLQAYTGYLQADAYGGYDGIYATGNVTEVACWAHARRKFHEAQASDKRRALQMLALIGALYTIEREAKEFSEAERATMRQTRSLPLLEQIKTWLDREQGEVLPRSPLGQAITYAQNQWPALCVYTTQGFLNIDNNTSERALKRVAIGRKNWLFAGNDAAAANHARLWSLLASAERHGLNPQSYLTSVLAKLRQTPRAELAQFLPDVWQQESAAAPLIASK